MGFKKLASEILAALTHFVFNQVRGKERGKYLWFKPKRDIFPIFARISVGRRVSVRAERTSAQMAVVMELCYYCTLKRNVSIYLAPGREKPT